MKRAECRGDLIALERRGLLSAAERRSVDGHVVACAPCRLARQIGADFDGVLRPNGYAADGAHDFGGLNDEAQIRGMVAAGKGWARQGTAWTRRMHRGRGRAALLVAACVVLVGTLAGATLEVGKRLHWERATAMLPVSPITVDEAREPAKRVRVHANRAPEPVVPETAGELLDPAAPSVPPSGAPEKEPKSVPPRAARTAAAPAETAPSIFRDANDARRRGDAAAAARLYRKLQRLHGNSPEAAMSLVPFGVLLLNNGDARTALHQFDRALHPPRSVLRAEALYGRARALAALGDASSERAAWTRLLAEFPSSPYATTARRRLEALQ